jgi:hypothetical protein
MKLPATAEDCWKNRISATAKLLAEQLSEKKAPTHVHICNGLFSAAPTRTPVGFHWRQRPPPFGDYTDSRRSEHIDQGLELGDASVDNPNQYWDHAFELVMPHWLRSIAGKRAAEAAADAAHAESNIVVLVFDDTLLTTFVDDEGNELAADDVEDYANLKVNVDSRTDDLIQNIGLQWLSSFEDYFPTDASGMERDGSGGKPAEFAKNILPLLKTKTLRSSVTSVEKRKLGVAMPIYDHHALATKSYTFVRPGVFTVKFVVATWAFPLQIAGSEFADVANNLVEKNLFEEAKHGLASVARRTGVKSFTMFHQRSCVSDPVELYGGEMCAFRLSEDPLAIARKCLEDGSIASGLVSSRPCADRRVHLYRQKLADAFAAVPDEDGDGDGEKRVEAYRSIHALIGDIRRDPVLSGNVAFANILANDGCKVLREFFDAVEIRECESLASDISTALLHDESKSHEKYGRRIYQLLEYQRDELAGDISNNWKKFRDHAEEYGAARAKMLREGKTAARFGAKNRKAFVGALRSGNAPRSRAAGVVWEWCGAPIRTICGSLTGYYQQVPVFGRHWIVPDLRAFERACSQARAAALAATGESAAMNDADPIFANMRSEHVFWRFVQPAFLDGSLPVRLTEDEDGDDVMEDDDAGDFALVRAVDAVVDGIEETLTDAEKANVRFASLFFVKLFERQSALSITNLALNRPGRTHVRDQKNAGVVHCGKYAICDDVYLN